MRLLTRRHPRTPWRASVDNQRPGIRGNVAEFRGMSVYGKMLGEAEGILLRQVRNNFILFTKTKSWKNRSIPIYDGPFKCLQKALPFKHSYDAFRRAVDAVELEPSTGKLTHVLRHTFASRYMSKGGDILTLQKMLGHATLAMTQKYTHFSAGYMAGGG